MSGINQLLHLMSRLRDKQNGCAWDIEQNFTSIAPYTIEEAYEVAEAISSGDMNALRMELGDLLLQVVFHSQIAKEEGFFDFEDVAKAICDKLIQRHPQIFANASSRTSEEQAVEWEKQKADERRRKALDQGRQPSVLDGVAVSLPALIRAQKLQKRAADVGFDWPDRYQVQDKLDEELDELEEAIEKNDTAAMAEEMGDVLFSAVNLARLLGVDAEDALRACNHKFERRFHHIESSAAQNNRQIQDYTLEELDQLWEQAK